MKKIVAAWVLIWILACTSLSALAEKWKIFDGEGADIIEDVTVEKSPSRFFISLLPAGELKIHYLNNTTGEEKFFISSSETSSSAGILFDAGQYDFFIETTSNWVAVIEPIKSIDSLKDITASISYVSDMFPINDPIIVKINAKSDDACIFRLDLYTKKEDAWVLSDQETEFIFGEYEIQKIFRAEQPTMGIYVIDLPNGVWSIEKK